MSARRVFAVGAVAGLVMWPATALAILVAVTVGNRKREAAHRVAVEAERRQWEAFERAHPEIAGEAL